MAKDFDFDMSGIAPIGEMSKEELIAELIKHHGLHLAEIELIRLKEMVIAIRMNHIQERMIREAGLKMENGFMGIPRLTEEDGS